jgi:hypothetical protein
MHNPFGNVPTGNSASGSKKYINLIQKSTEKDIKNGKPGKLYRSDTLEATDSIVGAIAFITRKRVYRNDEGSRCYSPDASIGKGKAGVHGINEACRACDSCEYKKKEDMGKSPCMIYFSANIVTPEGEEFILELRRSSYMVGNELLKLISGEGLPWETQVRIKGVKVANYYAFGVEDAGLTDANQIDMLTERNKELKRDYADNLYKLPEQQDGGAVPSVDPLTSGDVPF